MMIHEITAQVGTYKKRKRVGRGRGSGVGKTAGRGHKGAKSRAGYSFKASFEGGQMSFIRRIPKRGFSNANFRTDYRIVNVQFLNQHFQDGDEINLQTLVDRGILPDAKLPLKILGQGELTRKLEITAHKFSRSARQKIEAAGGTATTVEWRRKWTRAAHDAKADATPTADAEN